jgi:hypothetical protein
MAFFMPKFAFSLVISKEDLNFRVQIKKIRTAYD